MTSSAVDAKDLDPDLEHEKSVPTMEALLALNLKGSAVIVAVIIIVNYILTLYENINIQNYILNTFKCLTLCPSETQ